MMSHHCTTDQILETLQSTGKPVTKRTLYRYLEILKITPLGARTKPQLYPVDTIDRILIHLGLKQASPVVPPQADKSRIITVREAKRLARAGKGGRK